MNHSRDNYRPYRIYRNTERGVILGVCAGMAEFFGCPIWLTRGGALALGWFFPVTIILAYSVAALVLPKRPLRYCGQGDERSFWQSHASGADT